MEEIAASCPDELAACNAHAACPDELAVALASSPQDDATAEHDAVISCIGNSEFSPPSGPMGMMLLLMMAFGPALEMEGVCSAASNATSCAAAASFCT